MYDTSKNPLLETITLVDTLALTLDASVTRNLTYLARGLTITNNIGVPINVYTSSDSDYYVSIPDASIKEIDVSTDYYRIVAVGTPTSANVTVDILRSSIADSPTNAPDVGRALIDKVPIDARTEPYREIVQFDLSSSDSYNSIVAKYPDAWNAYYETGAAPAYSPDNAVKLQSAISFWLYMSAGEYIDASGNLISPETAQQIAGKEDHDFDPYNKDPGSGISTLNIPQIYFDPKAYDNSVDSLFTGSGLNDIAVDIIGTFDSTLATTRYAISIDSVGATDTFSWSDDNGVTWTTGVAITGASQTLSNSISITFGSVTGHTLSDNWLFNYRVSLLGLSAPFPKTVPRVQIDGTRIVSTVPGSGRNVQDTALFSASYLALTEYQTIRQNVPKGPYDWGAQYATGKKTY